MVYPSLALAACGDPLALAAEVQGTGVTLTATEARRLVADRLRPLVAGLVTPGVTGPADEAWYWAAPILLDLARHEGVTREWFDDDELADSWAGNQSEESEQGDEDEESLWKAHVAHARELVAGNVTLGPQPSDLV